MLRVTVHDKPDSVTFQLEGRLAGAWVWEVEECRRRALAGRWRPAVRFDLAGVTFIDAAGKAYLADMHRQGAAFVAPDCLTKAVVAEITKAPIPDCGRPIGLIGWLWFVSADPSGWKAVSLVAVLALAALVGITWYLSRLRANRRWRAALDAYAKQEQAKRPYSGRNGHARAQSQDR